MGIFHSYLELPECKGQPPIQVDELSAAMDSLERYVLTATESALKKSMALLGHGTAVYHAM